MLATEGAIKARVLQSKFEEAGIDVVIPDQRTQTMVSKIIYDIKKGKQPTSRMPTEISADLIEKGAQAIVLGCTELCIRSEEGTDFINTLDILAKATLEECNKL